MPKLILCRGPQGSGKTTWALQQLKQYPGRFKRLNRDLLREMLDGGEYSHLDEAIIRDVEVDLAERFLSNVYDVIVDDTNLKPETIAMWKQFIQRMGDPHTLEIEDFTHVPLEECIKRDNGRETSEDPRLRKKPIGEEIIRRDYAKYIAKEGTIDTTGTH
jgi:predicted kinase